MRALQFGLVRLLWTRLNNTSKVLRPRRRNAMRRPFRPLPVVVQPRWQLTSAFDNFDFQREVSCQCSLSLKCAVLSWRHGTDRQTDGRTHGRIAAYCSLMSTRGGHIITWRICRTADVTRMSVRRRAARSLAVVRWRHRRHVTWFPVCTWPRYRRGPHRERVAGGRRCSAMGV